MPRRQALPGEYGLAIIELQRRFYPVRIEHEQDGTVHLASFAHLLWETHHSLGIPFACGPQPTQGIVSFGTWKLAFDYCQRHYEQLGLPYQWRKITAGIELYPERTAWYRKALHELGADCLQMEVLADDAYCSVFVGRTHCYVCAETMDEALAELYQKVYELDRRWSGVAKAKSQERLKSG